MFRAKPLCAQFQVVLVDWRLQRSASECAAQPRPTSSKEAQKSEHFLHVHGLLVHFGAFELPLHCSMSASKLVRTVSESSHAHPAPIASPCACIPSLQCENHKFRGTEWKSPSSERRSHACLVSFNSMFPRRFPVNLFCRLSHSRKLDGLLLIGRNITQFCDPLARCLDAGVDLLDDRAHLTQFFHM